MPPLGGQLLGKGGSGSAGPSAKVTVPWPSLNSAIGNPIQALKEWQKKRPDLFVKRVYNVTGLNIEFGIEEIWSSDRPGCL